MSINIKALEAKIQEVGSVEDDAQGITDILCNLLDAANRVATDCDSPDEDKATPYSVLWHITSVLEDAPNFLGYTAKEE